MSNSKDAPSPPTVQPKQPNATRCVAIVVLVLILLTLFVVAVIWLAVQPKKLAYSIEHSSINGYAGNATGNATFHCLLRSRNPNRRVSFRFKRIEVEAYYHSGKLFNGSAAPFSQPVRNVTEVEVDLAEVRAALQGKEAGLFEAERAAGSVKMEVKVTGKINMKIGVFKVHRTVRATCGPYDVPFKESEGFRRVECDTDISY